MIATTQMLLDIYRDYANPGAKIKRLAESGELYPLTRGIYETDGNALGYWLAGAIFGSSMFDPKYHQESDKDAKYDYHY